MSSDGDSGPGRREVAHRLFAAEFDDASLSYSESDEERAPNYVVTPTGLRVNRLFAVGVLTEVESINDETLRGRIVDPTGAFVTYAGQYQPEAQAFLDRTTPPAFVAITGKARTFQPEDSDRVFTSVRPESLSEVEASTRDRWTVSAAEATLDRIAVYVAALDSSLRGEELQQALIEAGVDVSLATGIPRALDHYGTTTAYLDGLRRLAVDALELVADERDEVRSLDLAPGEGGDVDLGPLPTVDVDLGGEATPAAEPTPNQPSEEPISEPSEADATTAAESGDSVDTTSGEPDTPTSETVDVSADDPDTSGSEIDDISTETIDTESDPTVDEPAELDMTAEPSTDPSTETANGAADSAASASSDSETQPDSTVDDSDIDETGMYQLDDEEREQLESEYDTGFSSGNEVDPAGEADIDVPDADELAEKAQAETDTDESTASTTTETDSPADNGETLGDFDDGLGEFDETEGVGSAVETDDEPTTSSAEIDESMTTSSEADESTAATAETDDDSSTGSDDGAVTEADDGSSTEEPAPEESSTAEESPSATDIDLEETVIETMSELDDGDGVDRNRLVTEIVESYGVDETAVEEAIADALMGGRCYEPADDLLKAI